MKKFKGLCSVVLIVILCLSLSVMCYANVAPVTGDANGDHVVNLVDLVRMKKYTAYIVDEINVDAVDFDSNGLVDAYELVELKNILINLENPELIINVEKFEDKY